MEVSSMHQQRVKRAGKEEPGETSTLAEYAMYFKGDGEPTLTELRQLLGNGTFKIIDMAVQQPPFSFLVEGKEENVGLINNLSLWNCLPSGSGARVAKSSGD